MLLIRAKIFGFCGGLWLTMLNFMLHNVCKCEGLRRFGVLLLVVLMLL